MHSSDPASPYLACWARVPGFTIADFGRAMYEDRTLWRLHAMRWTLFVVPFRDSPILHAAAGMAVAEGERKRLEKWLSAELATGGISNWIDELEQSVLSRLKDGGEHRTRDLTSTVPGMNTEITLGSGKWAARVPVSSRILNLLAMDRKIVRARPAGTWRSSQYPWALASDWFDAPPEPIEPATGRGELLTRYLRTFGPATLVDIRWWAGWTARDSRAVIEEIRAVSVELDDGSEGFVLSDDVETLEPNPPTVALLPGLDSTPMGWKERSWYFGEHAGPLFDRNGNVGPTVWVGGRIVGGWGQRPDGLIVYRLLEDVGTEATRGIATEAEDLTTWLDGTIVTPRFRAPLERELSA